jgi:hypothetical protein
MSAASKIWAQYREAAEAMYAARHTVAELNAIPD